MTTTTLKKQITVEQVAAMLKIEPSAFLLIGEMQAVMGTQTEINDFLVKSIGYDCRVHKERRQVGQILKDMRVEKMKEYKLSLGEFVDWFKVDPIGALTHLLVEKISEIHMIRINEYKVTAEQIYKQHLNHPEEFLFGLLNLI